MRGLALFVITISFLLSCPVLAAESFRFSGKIKCELSATFIVFDFDKKIALRNNYICSRYRLSNYETKRNKFKKTVHTFSWYDVKDNFLGYWVISDDSRNVEEIKFDREGEIFSVTRTCSKFNNGNIGELVWK
jgi:hypothetical protein